MREINYGKCIRIAQEIGELLESREVTVTEAKHILKTVLGHADDHMSSMLFHVRHALSPILWESEKTVPEPCEAETTQPPCEVPSTAPD